MPYSRKITLNSDEISQCFNFAHQFAGANAQKSSHYFGSTQVEDRLLTDKTADTITGKLAEYAFMKFCHNHGVNISIDFDIANGKLNIDNGQDITKVNNRANQIKCDIKGAKHYSQWLMVENHKIDQQLIYAHLYIFIKLKLDPNVEKDLNLFNQETIEAEFAGYALRTDFFEPTAQQTPWFSYKAGQAPLKTSFVDSLLRYSEQQLAAGEALSKQHLRTAFRHIKDQFSHEQTFMNMCQKADKNLGLPVKYLRKTDQQIDNLLSALSQQNLAHIASSSIWEEG